LYKTNTSNRVNDTPNNTKKINKNLPRKKKKPKMIIPPKLPILIKPKLTQRSKGYWTNCNKVESHKNNTICFNLGI
jgi:hypothetical protein